MHSLFRAEQINPSRRDATAAPCEASSSQGTRGVGSLAPCLPPTRIVRGSRKKQVTRAGGRANGKSPYLGPWGPLPTRLPQYYCPHLCLCLKQSCTETRWDWETPAATPGEKNKPPQTAGSRKPRQDTYHRTRSEAGARHTKTDHVYGRVLQEHRETSVE